MALKLLFLLSAVNIGFAADIYFAQSSAGSNNGTSCANAYSATRFNTADSNWTAGNTLHLCGTWTGTAGQNGILATRGSGSAGNPITVKWESGAVITATYWGTAGAIQVNHNYIVLDGGTPCGPGTSCSSTDGSGILEATANGTSLANQVDSEGIHLGEGGQVHDVEIKNLVIRNMCVRTGNLASSAACTGNLIKCVAGGLCTNLSIHDNTLHDGVTAAQIIYDVSSGTAGSVYNNYIAKTNSSLIFATLANVTITGMSTYNNEFTDFWVWDETANNFHHECVHLFTNGNGHINSSQIYNNYAHGDFGIHATACVFIENAHDGTLVFNNFIKPSANQSTDGMIFFGVSTTNSAAYNNTIVSSGPCIGLQSSTGNIIKNNILSGCTTAINVQDVTSETGFSADYNIYYNATQWVWGGSIIGSFATWKTNCSCDTNSSTSNPTLNTDGSLIAGSPAINAGTNLSGLSITALNSDKNGVSRGTTWDMGAFEYVAAGSSPTRGVCSAEIGKLLCR